MLHPAPPLINRQDYEGMREGPPYFQVIEGNLITSPSPTPFHQAILGRIYLLLANFLAERPLGQVFLAPLDVFLNDTNIYQPDILFVAHKHSSRITARGIEGAPDLVVEILSPTTSQYDRGSKRKVYAKSGVGEMWLIDPDKREIQLFQLQRNPEKPAATFKPGQVLKSKTIPGLEFDCGPVFQR